jgi:hypothetical protein
MMQMKQFGDELELHSRYMMGKQVHKLALPL